jgi:hypothetical protein
MCLASLIDEAQAQRVLLQGISKAIGRLQHSLETQLQGENADIVQVNQRLSAIERTMRHAGITPSPA